MVPADIHDFFVAAAGVAGALIGLLFVAISVATERLAQDARSGQLHRIRAHAALVSFTNALAVSLFAMLPGQQIGTTSLVVAIVGLLFVAAVLMSLIRLRQVSWTTARDGIFLAGLAVVFVVQLDSGIDVILHPGDSDAVENIGILVAVCFLVGIARAWELVGGPSIGISHEIAAMVRGGDATRADPGPGRHAGSGAGTDQGAATSQPWDKPPA